MNQYLLVSSPTNKYVIFNIVLGKGSYGVVLLSQRVGQQRYFAMKIVSKLVLQQIRGTDNLRQEVLFLSKLHHPNIINMYESFEDDNYFYIVLENCTRGNLDELLIQHGSLTEGRAYKYFYQIVQAVRYLHQKNIIHRDLKLSNILISDNDQIKICDFNWATELINNQAEPILCGTLDYMPPEVCSFSFQDKKLDIWSLGILLYKLVHNSYPISCYNIEVSYSQEISQELQDLIKELLSFDKKMRPSIDQIFESKWMKQNQEKRNCCKRIALKQNSMSIIKTEY